jgi:hypothetical protein
MIIKKQLKNAIFEYNEDLKSFQITSGGITVQLNKVYAFAFMRFVVRMAQRNWLRSNKKLDKQSNDLLQSNDLDHPDQMKFLKY